jgi:hypothetical protein
MLFLVYRATVIVNQAEERIIMSNEIPDPQDMVTKPLQEHEWLKQLVGEWRIESEMTMEPGAPKLKSEGKASVKNMGGLWAVTETKETMPDGTEMQSYHALGFDVSFKEYRGCMFMSASSHLWKYVGELSADSKTMTLNCEGPDMVKDGETALYRDVIELIDENHRTLTSHGQDENGEWQEFMKAHYYRV